MQDFSYIRFFQASPNNLPLDIYVNDNLLKKNFAYKSFTEYKKANAGDYNIKIFPSNNKNMLMLDENITIYKSNIYTVAIIGQYNLNSLELNLISDHIRDIDKNYSYVRFANLSPDFNYLDIFLDDRLEISELSYATISNYLRFSPGKYYFKAYSPEQKKIILENPSLILNSKKIYSGYIIGVDNKIQIVLPLEGATYLKF